MNIYLLLYQIKKLSVDEQMFHDRSVAEHVALEPLYHTHVDVDGDRKVDDKLPKESENPETSKGKKWKVGFSNLPKKVYKYQPIPLNSYFLAKIFYSL